MANLHQHTRKLAAATAGTPRYLSNFISVSVLGVNGAVEDIVFCIFVDVGIWSRWSPGSGSLYPNAECVLDESAHLELVSDSLLLRCCCNTLYQG